MGGTLDKEGQVWYDICNSLCVPSLHWTRKRSWKRNHGTGRKYDLTKIFEMEQGVAMKKTLQDKLRNSSILKRWFFSYLLVFAVPLLLCFLLYRQAYHTIREEADQLTTVDVRDELQHVMVSHGNLAYVALILNQSDSVVTRTGYMSLPIFHRLSFGAGDFSLNELRDYMKQPHMLWDMLLQSDTNGRQYLLFTRTTIDNNFGKPTGTVVVAVS